MNPYLVFILLALAGAWILETVSGLLNIRALDPHLPREFEGVYDPAEYRRSQEYTRASQRLDLVSDTAITLLLAVAILTGLFDLADDAARELARLAGLGLTAAGLAFFGLIGLGYRLVSLPFSLYHTFVLEERFGFNTTTPGLYALDALKGLALTVAIGGPLLAGVLLAFRALGPWAWLAAWAGTVLVMLVVQYVAPTWILPLFNRFTPLGEGELRTRLEKCAASQGFDLTGIFVMDGSRRSTRSNAFFTGLGRKKRIALFDTLLERMNTDQIVAVTAHEIGHSRLGHVPRMLLSGVLRTGLLFFVMRFFLDTPELFAAFGVERVSVHAGLVFFAFLYTPVSLALSIWTNRRSRAWEYEADAFAARVTGDPDALISALKTLSVANLSNLTPHPLHVALHYSHPPVLARVRALRSLQPDHQPDHQPDQQPDQQDGGDSGPKAF